MATWITSDWHFNHDREFIYGPRGFSSIEEMNEEIVKRHNEVVTPDDEVYVLGDLMLGTDYESGIGFINRLNGNLHVILGNHDTTKRFGYYMRDLIHIWDYWEVPKYADILKYKGYTFYMSHFPTITSNLDDSNKRLKDKIINLCGHNHAQDFYIDAVKYNSLCFHVELDVNNCYPLSLDNIIEKIKFYGHK